MKSVAIGWGVTDTSYGSPILLKTEVDVVSNFQCREAMGERIKEAMVCAGAKGKDTCQGDSGGPLLSRRTNNDSYTALGITSWGQGCARPGTFGVYTRISHYLEWIATAL